MAAKKSGSAGDGTGNGERPAAKKAGSTRTTKSAGKGSAEKTSPEKTSANKGGAAAKPARASRKQAPAGPDLGADLRQFVSENPHGWGHGEWIGLLDRLRERGHSVDDTEQIGRSLERERLAATLEGVEGVGPQRVRSIVDRYETLWSLRQADVDDVAQSAKIPRPLAERIKAAV